MAKERGDSSFSPSLETDFSFEEGHLNNCSLALKGIFSVCDEGNAGSAHAQKLIAFVTPYLQKNESELAYLKKCLDPLNNNPALTETEFFDKMQFWISEVRTLSSPDKRRSFDSVSFHQFSSAESNFRKSLSENNTSELASLSSVSSSSGNSSNELQEFAKQLEFQNRKLLDELCLVKSQLAISEEQNELLQNDLRIISSKLAAEQNLNEKLQAERNENEELRDCSQNMAKKINLLEKTFSNVEKENVNLRQKLENLELENQKLEEKLVQARKKDQEKERLIVELRTEYDYKEAVIASLEKAVLEMQDKLKDNQQLIEHHVEMIENLTVKKDTMEKLLKGKAMSLSHSISSTPPHSLSPKSSVINSPVNSPLKNKSNSFVDHNTSSEDDLSLKLQMIDTGVEKRQSLLYELSQIVDQNEVNNNSQHAFNQLKEENDELKKRLEDYSQSLELLKVDLLSAKEKESNFIREREVFQDDLKILISEKFQLQNENDEFRKKVDELSMTLKSVQIKSQQLNKRIVELENELKLSVEREKLLAYEIITIKNENDRLLKKIEIGELSNDELSEEICLLKNELKTKENNVLVCENAKQELTKYINFLNIQLEEHDRGKSETEKKISRELTDYKIALETKEKNVVELQKNLENLTQKLNVLNDEYEGKFNEEIKRIKSVNDINETELKEKNEKLQKYLEENEKSIRYLTTNHHKLKENLSIKTDIEMFLRKYISRLEISIEEKEKLMKDINQELSTLRKILSTKENQMQVLEDDNQKIYDELMIAVEENDDLKIKLNEFNVIMSEQSEDKDSLVEFLKEEVKINEREKEELRNSFEEKDTSLKQYCEDNEKLKENLSLSKENVFNLEKKVNELLIELTDKDKNVKYLKNLVKDNEQKLQSVCQNLDETNKNYEKLQTTLKLKENRITDLEREIKSLQAQLQNFEILNKKLEDEEKQLKKLNDLNKQLEKNISEEIKSKLGLQEKMSHLEIYNYNLKSDIELLKNDLFNKESQLLEINIMNNSLKEKITEDHEEQLNEKGKEIDNLRSMIDQLNNRLISSDTLHNHIKSLQDQLKVREGELQAVKNELTSNNDLVKSLKDELNIVNRSLKLKQTSVDNYEKQIKEMTKVIDAKNSSLAVVSVEFEKLKDISAEKDKMLACFQKDLKELDNRYQKKTTDLEELTNLLLTKEKSIEKLKEKIQQLNLSLKKYQDEQQEEGTRDVRSPKAGKCSFNRLNIKIEKLQERNEVLEQQLQQEKKNYSKLKCEKNEILKQLEDLKRELEDSRKNATTVCNTVGESPDSPSANASSLLGSQSISDLLTNVRESLENLPNSCAKKRSAIEKLELRQKFETLALTLSVDAATIIERVKKQNDLFESILACFETEIGKTLDILENMKTNNRDLSTITEITQCVEQIHVISEMSLKLTKSAVNAGEFQQELKFIDSLCTLMNYASDVQRDLDNKTNASSTSAVRNKSKNFFEEINVILQSENKEDNDECDISVDLQQRKSYSPSPLLRKCRRLLKTTFFKVIYCAFALVLFIYAILTVFVTCLTNEGLCSPFVQIYRDTNPHPL